MTGIDCNSCSNGFFGPVCNISVEVRELDSYLTENKICSGNFQDNCRECVPNYYGKVRAMSHPYTNPVNVQALAPLTLKCAPLH